jgi:hypothetical protein
MLDDFLFLMFCSLPGTLTATFIVLKLFHILNWPWVLILSPLWIALLFIVFFIVSIILIEKLESLCPKFGYYI